MRRTHYNGCNRGHVGGTKEQIIGSDEAHTIKTLASRRQFRGRWPLGNWLLGVQPVDEDLNPSGDVRPQKKAPATAGAFCRSDGAPLAFDDVNDLVGLRTDYNVPAIY
jgi:hypothetical protein